MLLTGRRGEYCLLTPFVTGIEGGGGMSRGSGAARLSRLLFSLYALSRSMSLSRSLLASLPVFLGRSGGVCCESYSVVVGGAPNPPYPPPALGPLPVRWSELTADPGDSRYEPS